MRKDPLELSELSGSDLRRFKYEMTAWWKSELSIPGNSNTFQVYERPCTAFCMILLHNTDGISTVKTSKLEPQPLATSCSCSCCKL